jgi:apolipoprotein N-acyltransferase
LIVWPETAVRSAGLESSFEWLQGLSDGADTTLLVGVSQFEKFPSADAPDGTGFRARQMNLAVAFRPHAAEPDVYRKALLVPFAEYLPAPGFPWPSWLVGKTFDVVPGEGPGLFHLADGTPLAPLICWENLFSGFARRSAAGGARLLVQLTNDNWFGRTAAPLQHDAASVLRAVENGLPVVVSSNTGPSLVADAKGRIVARAPRLFEAAVVAAAVVPGRAETPFARGGWGFGTAAPVLAALAVLDGWRRRGDIPR